MTASDLCYMHAMHLYGTIRCGTWVVEDVRAVTMLNKLTFHLGKQHLLIYEVRHRYSTDEGNMCAGWNFDAPYHVCPFKYSST